MTRVTKRVPKKRSTKTINCDNEENVSHRQYSFIYNFPVKGEMIRVCKEFFLGTLSISQKPVYNAHASKDANEITKKDGKGKSITRRIFETNIQRPCKSYMEPFCIQIKIFYLKYQVTWFYKAFRTLFCYRKT